MTWTEEIQRRKQQDKLQTIKEKRAKADNDKASARRPKSQRPADTHSTAPTVEGTSSSRPTIAISTEEHDVNDAAVAALARDRLVFQRAGSLVRVLLDESKPADAQNHRHQSPRIEIMPQAILRERLTLGAAWVREKVNADGKRGAVPAHPPEWCLAAVNSRGYWPGIRFLEGVVEYPVLRRDRSLLLTPGYDPSSRLLFIPKGKLPTVAARPTLIDAQNAVRRLLEIVCDFPFKSDSHRSAYIAALLTPPARFAFEGPAPLFMFDANVRSAGKGKLADIIGLIITGDTLPRTPYTNEEEEFRKRITSMAMSGASLILLDNVTGRFGNGTFDAVLTATTWKDRTLGSNRMVEVPLQMTWLVTGNNVDPVGDMARRTCHIRLESPLERPEDRENFRHPDIEDYVRANREAFLGDVLTILLAHAKADSPVTAIPSWGSYEAWSRIVRSAIVWLGLPDPVETRIELQELADSPARAMNTFLKALQELDREKKGMTAAELVEAAKDPCNVELRDSIENLVGRIDARSLGAKLRHFRKRRFDGGLFLDDAGEKNRAMRWIVRESTDSAGGGSDSSPSSHSLSLGESDEGDESLPPPGKVLANGPAGPYRDRF